MPPLQPLPILVILGATGVQGGSVLSAFVSSNANATGTSPPYLIRALTSNPGSAAATRLASLPNVSVIQVDTTSEESLSQAFYSATAIFATTAFPPDVFSSRGAEAAAASEAEHGLTIVRAASKVSTLKHLIWSTLPDAEKISGGKSLVPHFQSKIPAENFIRSPESGLFDKTTLLCMGMYGSNLLKNPAYTPVYVKTINKYTVTLPCPPDVKLPFIGDEKRNIGTIVRAILEQPATTLGRYVLGEAEFMSARSWVSAFSMAHDDVDAVYMDCSLEAYVDLWGPLGLEIGLMMKYIGDFGEGAMADAAKGGRENTLLPSDLGLGPEQLVSTEDCLRSTGWAR